ncbi:MAG: PIG-L family deacetylase [Dehalococcoidales bacterium]|nr:PIG-L family deacetylase [Dehalococcoidales bacterium]
MSTKDKTLVFAGAHPDDESFGPGAILAKYALEGVKTYVICATGGEAGTVEPKYLEKYGSIKELREAELDCAAEKLGLTGLYRLGYRDSNMRGSPDNQNPECLAMAQVEEAAGRIVKIFREIKPDVVITHDEGGNYGHPDHIATNRATREAFFASGDASKYPEAGEPFQPSKLYYMVNPHKMMKWAVRLMPLFGQDPSRFGRNGDIDLRNMVKTEYPVHAAVLLKERELQIRNQASACHASQLGGGGRREGGVFRIVNLLQKYNKPKSNFMKVYPKPGWRKEKDLFEGLD